MLPDPGLFAFSKVILGIAVTGLHFASCFLQLAFLFQARIARNFACRFLDGAFSFPRATYNLIFVHTSLQCFGGCKEQVLIANTFLPLSPSASG